MIRIVPSTPTIFFDVWWHKKNDSRCMVDNNFYQFYPNAKSYEIMCLLHLLKRCPRTRICNTHKYKCTHTIVRIFFLKIMITLLGHRYMKVQLFFLHLLICWLARNCWRHAVLNIWYICLLLLGSLQGRGNDARGSGLLPIQRIDNFY